MSRTGVFQTLMGVGYRVPFKGKWHENARWMPSGSWQAWHPEHAGVSSPARMAARCCYGSAETWWGKRISRTQQDKG